MRYRVILAGVLAVLACGCQRRLVSAIHGKPEAPVSYYRAATVDGDTLRRVVIAPFENSGVSEKVAAEVTAAFADELGKQGRFEIVFPPSEPAFFLPHSRLRPDGTIDLATVTRLRRELGADAFLLGSVSGYKPYDPPLLALKVQLISATTGDVLWAADSIFDASEASVRRLAEAYYDEHQEQDSLFGWRILMVSPERFTRFVCHQILSTMEG